MKQPAILIVILALSLQGCGQSEREKNLQEQQMEINKKEQQLFVWEQRLKLREQELNAARHVLDSSHLQIDTAYNPLITGKWVAKMICTKTSCDGSAIGDTKTEQWDISYNGEEVVVKAYSGPVLIRVYTGSYKNKVLKIVDEKPNLEALISANLNFIDSTRMDGLREISQKDCKIIYELTLEKSK
ncbi:MAG: hypothetical protein WKF66_00815 [Pedobacter sp.]